jgi:hypothetical protein
MEPASLRLMLAGRKRLPCDISEDARTSLNDSDDPQTW